jgi:hypothetical protein
LMRSDRARERPCRHEVVLLRARPVHRPRIPPGVLEAVTKVRASFLHLSSAALVWPAAPSHSQFRSPPPSLVLAPIFVVSAWTLSAWCAEAVADMRAGSFNSTFW